MSKQILVAVIVNSAFVIDGEIITASDKVVEIPEKLAKNLLHRGKVTLATGDDVHSLQDHTKAELQEILKEYGVEFDAKATKADLIALIEAHEAHEGEGE